MFYGFWIGLTRTVSGTHYFPSGYPISLLYRKDEVFLVDCCSLPLDRPQLRTLCSNRWAFSAGAWWPLNQYPLTQSPALGNGVPSMQRQIRPNIKLRQEALLAQNPELSTISEATGTYDCLRSSVPGLASFRPITLTPRVASHPSAATSSS